MDFVWSVLASVVAGVVLIAGAGLLSRTARNALVAAVAALLDIDVERVFKNPREAAADVVSELDRSSEVALLTGRGSELQRETFGSLFAAESQERRRVRILLPEVMPSSRDNDWIADREAELASFDPAFGQDLLRSQITTTWRFLEPLVRRSVIEVRAYNYPHVGRILLTERAVYFTPYRRDAHGRDCRVFKYHRGGEMYECLSRLFEQLWRVGGKRFS